MPLPAGTTAAEGASWFVNPLTALGMTETMSVRATRRSSTAAASNLGQMLKKICLKDGIALVIVISIDSSPPMMPAISAKHRYIVPMSLWFVE